MYKTFEAIKSYEKPKCAYVYLTEKLWLVNGRKGDFMHGPEMTNKKIIVCCRETGTSGESDCKRGIPVCPMWFSSTSSSSSFYTFKGKECNESFYYTFTPYTTLTENPK
jgi:hypothetical protein